MKRSIRTTLLLWYGAILVGVTAGSAGLIYVHQRRTSDEEVDAEIRTHMVAIASGMRPVKDRSREGATEPPYPGKERRMRARGWREGWRNDWIKIEDSYVAHFESELPDAPYLVIFDRRGAITYSSPSAPELTEPPAPGRHEAPARRHLVRRLENGTTIVVGRGTARMEAELADFRNNLILVAVGTLALALLGGALLVRKVLRPIARISQTASRISVANLSQRIDVGGTESELGRLAITLNDAFDRLESALERQIRFTSDASHELRTPLAVIRATVEWVSRRKRTLDEHEEALASIRRASDRLEQLVESLLHLARSESSGDPVRAESLDLGEVTADAVEMVRTLAERRDVELELEQRPAPAIGEPERMRALATELVTNAIVHIGQGSRVRVRTGTTGETSCLEVRDNGPGIPAEDLDHVCERFYRADESRSGHGGGAGLGLSIVRTIVEAHDGDLQIENNEGAGLTVTARFPQRASDPDS